MPNRDWTGELNSVGLVWDCVV